MLVAGSHIAYAKPLLTCHRLVKQRRNPTKPFHGGTCFMGMCLMGTHLTGVYLMGNAPHGMHLAGRTARKVGTNEL
jgi:hypothetical protein